MNIISTNEAHFDFLLCLNILKFNQPSFPFLILDTLHKLPMKELKKSSAVEEIFAYHAVSVGFESH